MYLNRYNKWKVLPIQYVPRGYKQIKAGLTVAILYHRAVYETFKDVQLPSNVVINHIDHNKLNNNINNLEIVTQNMNADDRVDREYIDDLPDDAIDLKRNYIHKFYYLPSTN